MFVFMITLEIVSVSYFKLNFLACRVEFYCLAVPVVMVFYLAHFQEVIRGFKLLIGCH